MKVSELKQVCEQHLADHGDCEVELYYFDPADGETGTGNSTDDYAIDNGPGHFNISLQHDVSAVLLDPEGS